MTGEEYREIIKKKLDDLMRENNCGLIFYIVYKCKLTKTNNDGEEETEKENFYSETRRILDMIEYDETYKNAIDHINEKMGIYVSEKSNLKLDSIEEIYLNVAKYTPLKGSSWVPTL